MSLWTKLLLAVCLLLVVWWVLAVFYTGVFNEPVPVAPFVVATLFVLAAVAAIPRRIP